LTAGGVALLFVMPLAGYATGKVSARTLTVIGFTLFVLTFRYAAVVTTLEMTFCRASWLRVVQMIPIPFCFISITTAAYVGMPKEESNQVAGIINFARNIGGSILIAVTNAQVTSRTMWHQQHLQGAMTSGSIAFQQHTQALTGFFGSSFGGPNGQDGPGLHLRPAQPAGADAGLPGRLHGAVVDVGGAGGAGLPAEQEQAGRGSRRRNRQTGPCQPQAHSAASSSGWSAGRARTLARRMAARGSRRFPAGSRQSCQSRWLSSKISTSRSSWRC
jgi:hypothetical protein